MMRIVDPPRTAPLRRAPVTERRRVVLYFHAARRCLNCADVRLAPEKKTDQSTRPQTYSGIHVLHDVTRFRGRKTTARARVGDTGGYAPQIG